MVNPTYPGVYIEEFSPGPPIQGIGTSTPAFLGQASYGPPMEPKRVSSIDAFLDTFASNGAQRVKPDDTDYLWYAVNGYFQNAGQECYIVRLSNAQADWAELQDRHAVPTILVKARKLGANSGIRVQVSSSSAVSTAVLFAPNATISSAVQDTTVIYVTSADDARKFLPGNGIVVTDAANSEPLTVVRVDDVTTGGMIRVAEKLKNRYTTGRVHLAALQGSVEFIRVENGQGLVSGSIIEFPTAAGATPVYAVVNSVQGERISSSLVTYRIGLKEAIASNYDLDSTQPGYSPVNIKSLEFTLSVDNGGTVTPYSDLSMDPAHPRYFATVINSDPSGLIFAQPVVPPNTAPPPANQPQDGQTVALANGIANDPTKVNWTTYREALKLLEPLNDVAMIVAPGLTDPATQSDILDHCTRLKDRVAILDSARGEGPNEVETHRNSLHSWGGYGALYYPWLQIRSVKNADTPILVPPSGHIAGIYARIDSARGVHKAPAGNEAVVNGAIGVERMLNDVDHGHLNQANVNVIRVFQNGGPPMLWGARTLTVDDDTTWQYLNIRRLFIYLEGSIKEGIRWAVFEPNTPALWAQLKRTITDFLMRTWRGGALYGTKASDAFYVRIDDVLNPFSDRQLGRLNIEIGVCPSYPAEFIMVRIGIWSGGSEVSEG